MTLMDPFTDMGLSKAFALHPDHPNALNACRVTANFGLMGLETCEPEGPPCQRMPYAPDHQP